MYQTVVSLSHVKASILNQGQDHIIAVCGSLKEVIDGVMSITNNLAQS